MFTTVILSSLFVAAVFARPHPVVKVESAEAAFTRMDTDKDGLIDVNDYVHRNPWYTGHTKKTFNEMDANADGKVSVTEYKAYHDMIEESMKKEAEKAAFNWANSTISKFDQDGDDMLSTTELDTFLKSRFFQESDNYDDLIKPFDKDSNKHLDLAELTKFLANIPFDKLKQCPVPDIVPATLGLPKPFQQ